MSLRDNIIEKFWYPNGAETACAIQDILTVPALMRQAMFYQDVGIVKPADFSDGDAAAAIHEIMIRKGIKSIDFSLIGFMHSVGTSWLMCKQPLIPADDKILQHFGVSYDACTVVWDNLRSATRNPEAITVSRYGANLFAAMQNALLLNHFYERVDKKGLASDPDFAEKMRHLVRTDTALAAYKADNPTPNEKYDAAEEQLNLLRAQVFCDLAPDLLLGQHWDRRVYTPIMPYLALKM